MRVQISNMMVIIVVEPSVSCNLGLFVLFVYGAASAYSLFKSRRTNCRLYALMSPVAPSTSLRALAMYAMEFARSKVTQ